MKRLNFKLFGKISIVFVVLIMLGASYFSFYRTPQPFSVSEIVTPKKYDFYIIVDETTNETLMYVPVTVSVGDELISENNSHYIIAKVVDDIGYARAAGTANLRLGEENFL